MNPTDLAEARLRRRIRGANPSIGKETAREMTAELSDLIERARKLWTADPDFPAVGGEARLSQTVMRAIIEDQGDASAANDGEYLADMLSGPDGSSDLYLCYLRLFDRINGTNLADDLADPPARKPELALVRDDLPPLETLKQAVITAIRQAQKGQGSGKILELLPAFKARVKLDFITNAEERHRAALFDLARQAGIPLD